MNLDDIVNHLPQLTRHELQQLKQWCQKLLAGTPSDDIVADENLVLSLICDCLRNGQVEFISTDRLRHSQGIGSFREKLPELMRFFSRHNISHTQRYGLLVIGLQLLRDNLRAMNIPVGGNAMLNHIHRLPEMLDWQFPGYAHAGLLGIIIRNGGRDGHDKSVDKKVIKPSKSR